MSNSGMPEQLARVALNLNETIVEFFKLRLSGLENRFTANDLRHYVNAKNFGTAPASADRVMRNLKKEGKINYVVVNRSKSLYQAIPVEFPTKSYTGAERRKANPGDRRNGSAFNYNSTGKARRDQESYWSTNRTVSGDRRRA